MEVSNHMNFIPSLTKIDQFVSTIFINGRTNERTNERSHLKTISWVPRPCCRLCVGVEKHKARFAWHKTPASDVHNSITDARNWIPTPVRQQGLWNDSSWFWSGQVHVNFGGELLLLLTWLIYACLYPLLVLHTPAVWKLPRGPFHSSHLWLHINKTKGLHFEAFYFLPSTANLFPFLLQSLPTPFIVL